ncbi:MAG: hypothetical protein FWD59_01535 [Micrococcales bacterium]|nr:hypothetical protein [Micrococcales bacterium]
MSTRRTLAIVLGAALVGSTLLVSPAAAVPPVDQKATTSCSLDYITKTTGLKGNPVDDFTAKKGKTISFTLVTPKGCKGTAKVKLGSKVVAKAKLKKNGTVKLIVSGSKIKTAKYHELTFWLGKNREMFTMGLQVK